MHRRDQLRAVIQLQSFAANFIHGHASSGQPANSAGAERDNRRWTYSAPLKIEPPATSVDFRDTRLLVNTFLATRFEFEVLYSVGDIGGPAIDPGARQRSVENLPRWADEWASGNVFLIAWLFSDYHQIRYFRPFSKHGLTCALVNIAAGARPYLPPCISQRRAARRRRRLRAAFGPIP